MQPNNERSIYGDPIAYLKDLLFEYTLHNYAVVMLIWLAIVSGRTKYRLAVAVTGRSSAGKSHCLATAMELVPDGWALFASRISVAGLFAAKNLSALVTDELIEEPELRAILRQVISMGRVEQSLATPSGKVRHNVIEGPIAYVSLTLDDRTREFQDANRMLVCRVRDTADQARHNCEMAVGQYVIAASTLNDRKKAAAKDVHNLVGSLDRQLQVILPDVTRLVPKTPTIDAPRRLQLLCNVACMIAMVRQFHRKHDKYLLYAEPEDIEDAFNLLNDAHVVDDREYIPGYALEFLSTFEDLNRDNKGDTIDKIVQKLNLNTVDKPGMPSGQMWTRRKVDYRIKALRDAGFVERVDTSTPHRWILAKRHSSLPGMSVMEQASLAWKSKA